MIGFAGAKAKCDWLENDLKFDAVFNYKEIDVDKALNQAAPNGVDCYWDNVSFIWYINKRKRVTLYMQVQFQ